MAGEVLERQKKGGGEQGPRRPKRRLAVRIDMTPMVDIAFLLLIFYMVSTVFTMPQAMEINLPPSDERPPIPESDLLTIRVDAQQRYWWNMEIPTLGNLPQLLPSGPGISDTLSYVLNPDSLRSLLETRNRANPKLSTLILINPKATYADMVNILDEIDVIERAWNEARAQELGKDIDELTREEKFSYRYAVGEWEGSDDKIMKAAIKAATEEGKL
jgi:biopolymer transport protein ExbD